MVKVQFTFVFCENYVKLNKINFIEVELTFDYSLNMYVFRAVFPILTVNHFLSTNHYYMPTHPALLSRNLIG